MGSEQLPFLQLLPFDLAGTTWPLFLFHPQDVFLFWLGLPSIILLFFATNSLSFGKWPEVCVSIYFFLFSFFIDDHGIESSAQSKKKKVVNPNVGHFMEIAEASGDHLLQR